MTDDLLRLLIPMATLLIGVVGAHLWHTRRQRQIKAWPRSFNLVARPVFNTEERLLHRELKAALPQHVVLAKVNLLRFCHSAQDRDARLWFERLHPVTVTFAICTPNGSVVSVIDLEANSRTASQRTLKLKEAVLDACRIRYIRCAPGHWPKPALLAQWALGGSVGLDLPVDTGARTQPPVDSPLTLARVELAQKLHRRRAERASRFHDSAFASDSFFAADSRFDGAVIGTEPLETPRATPSRASASGSTPTGVPAGLAAAASRA